MSFPLLPALALVVYNVIELNLGVRRLVASGALDAALRDTRDKTLVISALQREYDVVAVYVGTC